MIDITTTFLELGDLTSQNLEFSHLDDVHVRYGEETITEFNLLEIRRRHHNRVRIKTFTRHEEATNGADWEWKIIGNIYTYNMRVQAKRLQRDDILKINHRVKSSGQLQRKLLIDEAERDKMKPVYCIYCSEPQRAIWKERTFSGYRSYQSGCLLADASVVLPKVKKLVDIEDKCIPWHFLFCRKIACRKIIRTMLEGTEDSIEIVEQRQVHLPRIAYPDTVREYSKLSDFSPWNPPTIKDLNEDTRRDFDRTGVEETVEHGIDTIRFDKEYSKLKGIYRILVMDVRDNIEDRNLS